jgi:hypothetical protein
MNQWALLGLLVLLLSGCLTSERRGGGGSEGTANIPLSVRWQSLGDSVPEPYQLTLYQWDAEDPEGRRAQKLDLRISQKNEEIFAIPAGLYGVLVSSKDGMRQVWSGVQRLDSATQLALVPRPTVLVADLPSEGYLAYTPFNQGSQISQRVPIGSYVWSNGLRLVQVKASQEGIVQRDLSLGLWTGFDAAVFKEWLWKDTTWNWADSSRIDWVGPQGSATPDGGVFVPSGTYLKLWHHFLSNGGGIAVNHYTLAMDIKLPTNHSFLSLLQTGSDAYNESELWVDSRGAIGSTKLGWTAAVLPKNRWVRIVIVVDNLDKIMDIWADGQKLKRFESLPTQRDGHFSLWTLYKEYTPSLSLFGDPQKGDGNVEVRRIALWDSCAPDAKILEWGAYPNLYPSIP